MGTEPLACIEEHSAERVVSFFVNCHSPEESAWNTLRDWVTHSVSDYRARRYIGCAPKGHHPSGDEHHRNEEIGCHEYVAQMFLFDDEGKNDTFVGAPVCDGPEGLYLVGDVVMNEFNDDGTIDIGSSLQKAAGVMFECLKAMGGYDLDLKARPHLEEHIFSDEWFDGSGGLAGLKLWLPIRKA